MQRLTRTVQIGVTDSEARHILIESLAYENANIESKWILGSLKIRSEPMNEWVLHTMNVETLDYGTEVWVGEAISNGKKRHQNTKYNTKYFNCDRMGYLRRIIDNEFLGIMPPLGIAEIGGLSLQVFVGGVAKVNIGPMNVGQ